MHSHSAPRSANAPRTTIRLLASAPLRRTCGLRRMSPGPNKFAPVATAHPRGIRRQTCHTCRHRNPPIHDVLIGEKVPESTDENEFAEISSLESKSTEERWEHFKEELSKCIRCYACRNVCPLCYCKMCFVDQSMPAWFGKTNDLSDTMIYHLVRALHVAGRCVDCGACTRACPMDINLRELVKKTEKIMKERYNYEAGLDPEEVPPLGEFKMEDPQEFIK